MNKGVISQGIVCPIVREGDNIVDIVVDSLLKETKTYRGGVESYYDIQDKSIVGITESLVARSAGLYVTVDEIAEDIEKKFGKDAEICLVYPIYSRNRFSMILKGIARAAKKISIMMPPSDEVGNPRGVNPFTGVNIEKYYKEICESENCECIINDGTFDKLNFIYCGLHDYKNTSAVESKCLTGHSWVYAPLSKVKLYTLADICPDKNPDYGLLGTNKATEERLKLFPTKALADKVCEEVKAKIKEKTGKDVIVLVYGDGCFKDPVGGIWEFADPDTCPGYTDKELLESTPNEVKLKALIDNRNNDRFADVAIKEDIETYHSMNRKDKGQMGTTPRLYKDLLASLMDLTSGSGDRGTPVILVQNYFR